jgi:hypothetical protein
MKLKNIIYNYILFVLIIILVNNFNFITLSTQIKSDIKVRNSNYPPIGWSEDVGISDLTNDYSCQFPNIATNGKYIHVLWDENLNSSNIPGHGLCYRRSSDGGNNWEDIAYLTHPYDSIINDIAVSDSNIHVVFTSHIPNTTGIKYRRSIDNGNSWGPINSNLTELGGTDLNIAVNNNLIHIVYSYKVTAENVWRIIYLKSFDNGDTWEKPRYLLEGKGTTNYLRPRLAVNNNFVYISYWGINSTIELIKSNNNGDTWEFKTLNTGPDVGYPKVASYENHVGVVWVDTSIPLEEIVFIKSDDYGTTWSEPKIITDKNEYIYLSNPVITMDGNTYHLAWSDYRDWSVEGNPVHPEIYYKKSTDNGNTWTNDIRLTKKVKAGSYYPSISSYENNPYLVWEDDRDGPRSQIYFKRTLPDFTIENVQIPSNIFMNATININLTLNNVGYADAYNVPITIKDTTNILYDGEIDQIILDKKKFISILWMPPHEGQYDLEFLLDIENKLEEWNESNNNYYKKITVIKNAAPTAVMDIDKTETITEQDIVFDASKSYDPDGTIDAYYFDFGDGNNSGWIEQSIIEYNYSRSGIFSSSLTVRDDHGAENLNEIEHIIKIELRELPPIIYNVTFYPGNPVTNENITLMVDASDPNLDDIEYIHEPENGSIIGTGPSVIWRSPHKPGEYQIIIKVFDGTFYSSPWILNIFVIENHQPIIHNIDYNISIINPGDVINISVNASDPDNHYIDFHFYSSAGSNYVNGSNLTWYSPEEPGIYILTVNVSDKYGGFDRRNLYFMVGNPDPSWIIKSFRIQPDRINTDEEIEVKLSIEIDNNLSSIISQIHVDLSSLNGLPNQILTDSGEDGDDFKGDGVFSNVVLLKSDETGEHEIFATLETNIQDIKFIISGNLTVNERPADNGDLSGSTLAGISFLIILMIILIIILHNRYKKKNLIQAQQEKSDQVTDNKNELKKKEDKESSNVILKK